MLCYLITRLPIHVLSLTAYIHCPCCCPSHSSCYLGCEASCLALMLHLAWQLIPACTLPFPSKRHDYSQCALPSSCCAGSSAVEHVRCCCHSALQEHTLESTLLVWTTLCSSYHPAHRVQTPLSAACIHVQSGTTLMHTACMCRPLLLTFHRCLFPAAVNALTCQERWRQLLPAGTAIVASP